MFKQCEPLDFVHILQEYLPDAWKLLNYPIRVTQGPIPPDKMDKPNQ